jgi:hypothetical protein
VKGPEGYASWQDAATTERLRRVKAEQALAAQPAAAQEPQAARYNELLMAIGELSAAMGCPAVGGSYPRSVESETVRFAIARLTDTQRSSSGARSDEQKEVQRGAQEQQDAARYRWLRDACSMDNWRDVLCDFSPDELDAHIDRALTQSRREP